MHVFFQFWEREKKIQMDAFLACILEILLSYVGPNSKNNIKFVCNEERALFEQACHLNTCNRNSSHFIRLPGDSNPWEISLKMFSLANFQASFPSQVFFKNSEHQCRWQKFLDAVKAPLSDILWYYHLTVNGNMRLQ